MLIFGCEDGVGGDSDGDDGGGSDSGGGSSGGGGSDSGGGVGVDSSNGSVVPNLNY